MAAFALLPFALSIGLDLFITIERSFGLGAGLAVGGSNRCAGAVLLVRRRAFPAPPVGRNETVDGAAARRRRRTDAPSCRIEQMLTEARVILPGAQALLGFQLIVVATRSFDALPAAARLVHAIALILLRHLRILLMAPAAYHRIVCEARTASSSFASASTLVISATLPLALGIGCDVGIVMTEIFHSPMAGAGIAVLVTAGFVTLW